MKAFYFLAFVIVFALAACSAPSPTALPPTSVPQPTEDTYLIETRAAVQIFSTQTASVPTATDTPEDTATPNPTATFTPTDTPTITESPAPTASRTRARTPTAAPTLTNTTAPTNTPTPLPTPIGNPAPVLQNQPVHLPGWDVTLVSVRRDKAIWGEGDNAETAKGIYAVFLFQVRNLQGDSSYLGSMFGFMVVADGSQAVYYGRFTSVEDKAQYFYSCCISPFSDLQAGEMNLVLIPFDVPEGTKTLGFFFTAPNPSNQPLPPVSPEFLVPDFDRVPPRSGN